MEVAVTHGIKKLCNWVWSLYLYCSFCICCLNLKFIDGWFHIWVNCWHKTHPLETLKLCMLHMLLVSIKVNLPRATWKGRTHPSLGRSRCNNELSSRIRRRPLQQLPEGNRLEICIWSVNSNQLHKQLQKALSWCRCSAWILGNLSPLRTFQILSYSRELTSTISSSMAAFMEYWSYLLTLVVDKENGWSFFGAAWASSTFEDFDLVFLDIIKLIVSNNNYMI